MIPYEKPIDRQQKAAEAEAIVERRPYTRTPSQKISDEIKNKDLHEDIAWGIHNRGEDK